MKTETLQQFNESAGGNVQVDALVLAAGETLPLQGYPEERLYYAKEGRGVLSVYDGMEKGDLYVLRPDVAAYFTPGLLHEIANTGDGALELLTFRVTGGKIPVGSLDGIQKWTNIGESKDVGCGFWYTDVFNTGENETVREGLHLEIWGIGTRRAQKLTDGEVLSIAPHRATRPHTHSDSHETFYILMGRGNFVWDDRKIPCEAGQLLSYPFDVIRCVENTGDTPLMYLCIGTRP